MKNNKIFPWVVAFSAFTISFSAAFYSVYGISKMFAGASTNVMIMASSLEFAKLVIASFLYRFWNDINKILRWYLSISCILLVCITSAGIYGYLSSAYQETSNKVEKIDKSTGIISKKKEILEKEIAQEEKQLEYKNGRQNSLSEIRNKQQANQDNLISNNKSLSGIRSQTDQIVKENSKLDDDIKVIQDSIESKNKQISDLDIQILSISSNSEVASEIGPLKYLSKLTGKSMDEVVNWFIFILMIVFDPLAISLVIAANFVFEYVSKNLKETPINEEPDIQEIETKEPIENYTENIIEEDIDIQGDPTDIYEEEIPEDKIQEKLEAIKEEYTGFVPSTSESNEMYHPLTLDPTKIL